MSAPPPPFIPPNALFTSVKASAISVDGPVAADAFSMTANAGKVSLVAGVATVGGLALTANDRVFVVSGGTGATGTGGSLAVSGLVTGLQTTGPSFTVKSSFANDVSSVSWFVVGSPNFA